MPTPTRMAVLVAGAALSTGLVIAAPVASAADQPSQAYTCARQQAIAGEPEPYTMDIAVWTDAPGGNYQVGASVPLSPISVQVQLPEIAPQGLPDSSGPQVSGTVKMKIDRPGGAISNVAAALPPVAMSSSTWNGIQVPPDKAKVSGNYDLKVSEIDFEFTGQRLTSWTVACVPNEGEPMLLTWNVTAPNPTPTPTSSAPPVVPKVVRTDATQPAPAPSPGWLLGGLGVLVAAGAAGLGAARIRRHRA